MSDSRILPENTKQAAGNGFLFSDWDVPSEEQGVEIPQFDGKIIARMPDLGGDCFISTINRSKTPSFWAKAVCSLSSVIQKNPTQPFQGTQQQGTQQQCTQQPRGTQQQFFSRLTAIGCAVLLCGIVIIYIGNEDNTTETASNTAEAVQEEKAISLPNEPVIVREASGTQSGFVPIFSAEIPSASSSVDVAALPPPVAPPVQSDSPWDRPVADSYSPWDVAPRQPVHSEGLFAVAHNPSAPVTPATAVAATTVAMSPMTNNMSMAVSPHEQQLFMPPSHSPVQLPADPFIQSNPHAVSGNNVVSGMMPMHGRQENTPGIAASNGARPPATAPIHPQYVPHSVMQSMGMHPHHQQNQHPSHHPHGMMVPPNSPIPAGVSTLPVQGAPHVHGAPHPQQHPGQHPGMSSQRPGSFHPANRVFY